MIRTEGEDEPLVACATMQAVFPFIVGSGRSGTTLVQAIFDQHPELATTHESHFVAPLAKHRRRYEKGAGFDVDRFLDDLFGDPNFRRLGIDRADLAADFSLHAPADYSGAVRVVFERFATDHGKPRYADKTPGYVVHIPLLASVFPEARFLHIIRDGRDVGLSYMETSWGPSDLPAAALYWRTRVGAGRAAGARLGQARYREVRYEDLVADPGPVIRSLCPFFDLDFRPEMLEYFKAADEFTATTPDPGVHSRLALPPTKGLRDWRSQMASRDVEVFEALAGGLLSDLGYDRVTEKVPWRARVAAIGAWIRWQALRGSTILRRMVPMMR